MRNRALIAVLALGALRWSEAVALKWGDADFENGVLTVRHGKGDKAREVPLAGEFALHALRAWQKCLPGGREYVFRAIGKGDKIGSDKAISGTDVYRIVKSTEKLAGVEFAPHDLRRTYARLLHDAGVSVVAIQQNLGHASLDTTLAYTGDLNIAQRQPPTILRPNMGWLKE